MEERGVLQNLIPDVGQLKPAQVPIEEWIIDPYECGLLGGSGSDVCFPSPLWKKMFTLIHCSEEYDYVHIWGRVP